MGDIFLLVSLGVNISFGGVISLVVICMGILKQRRKSNARDKTNQNESDPPPRGKAVEQGLVNSKREQHTTGYWIAKIDARVTFDRSDDYRLII